MSYVALRGVLRETPGSLDRERANGVRDLTLAFDDFAIFQDGADANGVVGLDAGDYIRSGLIDVSQLAEDTDGQSYRVRRLEERRQESITNGQTSRIKRRHQGGRGECEVIKVIKSLCR